MSKERYRSILVFALTVICTLMYAAYSSLPDGSTDKSVLAENSADTGIESSMIGIGDDGTASDAVDVTDGEVHMVIPCGTPIGIYVKTAGVMVIATSEIVSKNGTSSEPCLGIIRQGDYIVGINGEQVEDKNDLIELVEKSQGETLAVRVVRAGEEINVNVTPVMNEKGSYMLGLWVKDDISGIGTLTYIDEDGFGALGHSINDNDTGVAFTISDGAIYDASLINVVKPDNNSPGRLEGVIDYSGEHILGRVDTNSANGIQGYLTKHGMDEISGEWIPVADKEQAHPGRAYLLSSISGKSEYYEIEITNIDYSKSEGSKSIELVVTDERLLDITNGIVQGMSGTPIIQDGRLLGAVTHVFLKDSARGYGILIDSMMGE